MGSPAASGEPLGCEVGEITVKWHLTSAPLFQLPNPDFHFVVELDASEICIGAVLSQQSGPNPCAFFSHCLSPLECNYDVGDRELLAVKMALWRSGGTGWTEPNMPFWFGQITNL